MDLGLPGRPAAAATYAGGDLRGRGAIAGLLRTAVGAPSTIIATPTRARGPPPLAAAAPATAVADFFLRLANPGAGWSRGWTSGCRSGRDLWGLGAIAGLLRTAAGVSGVLSSCVVGRDGDIFLDGGGGRCEDGLGGEGGDYGVGRAPLTIRFLFAFGEFRPR